MRVTILGSGTAIPTPDRFPAGYLIEQDDHLALVDLGPGICRRLGQLGKDLGAIDAVLLTHYHTDHCADLAALLFGLRNPRFDRRPPLRVIGHAGLRRLVSRLTDAWPWLEPRNYELRLDEITPGTLQVGPLTVDAVAIEHTPESLGYRIRAGRAVASFSGDATLCDGLTELARDADLFVCDAAFPTAHPGPGHMTATEAGVAAARAGARRLCLTHFYPECDGHDLRAEAAARFDGEIMLAEDFASFDL